MHTLAYYSVVGFSLKAAFSLGMGFIAYGLLRWVLVPGYVVLIWGWVWYYVVVRGGRKFGFEGEAPARHKEYLSCLTWSVERVKIGSRFLYVTLCTKFGLGLKYFKGKGQIFERVIFWGEWGPSVRW